VSSSFIVGNSVVNLLTGFLLLGVFGFGALHFTKKRSPFLYPPTDFSSKISFRFAHEHFTHTPFHNI
ncbi:hypothetical protein, partial [Brevibacillus gelatini]|uniref:hypothetical protein n=1 Tax=Brevibacillus gelatini TaxID=1655277 RepID=UPI001B87E1EF